MTTPSKIERGTLGATRVSRSITLGFGLLRKQLWLWPVLAAVMLAAAGVLIRSAVEQAAKGELAKSLDTILQADVKALQVWMNNHQMDALGLAEDSRLRKVTAELAQIAAMSPDDPTPLLQSDLQNEVRQLVKAQLEGRDYVGYVLLDRSGTILSSDHSELIGKEAPSEYAQLLARTLEKAKTVSRPFPSTVLLRDENRELRAGLPTMFAAARVNNPTGDPAGAVFLRLKPEWGFTEILQVARSGQTGETYAFDKDGLMLSESRFDDHLRAAGLIPDQPGAKSILTIHVRNPGLDLTTGARAALPRSKQPLTYMAAQAIAGRPGVNVEGYRDYRGVPVVGAWTWLSDYEFGVTAEIDVAEAYAPIYVLRRAFWGLFGLLAACGGLILLFTVAMARMQKVAQKAALAAKQLGQYQLEEKLGEGGMGVVYRGRHKLLRRPTAIKLLHPEKTTDEAIARFEREVQLTCQLNHPNTVAIYDFGRTPEGIFFYAMEYLEGIDLDGLISRHGRQTEGRVIHILRQICGSLAEAHAISLVHRDIKPANLMLCRRGGVSDVVKVLDFGLVKAVDAQKQATLTAANVVMGTPNFMPPESFERPEAVGPQSDLYAVAAVGYFLLTGTPPFSGKSAIEICMHHVKTPPQLPSERVGVAIDADLEGVLLRGLAKLPSDRFASATEFADALAACASASKWTARRADAWWAAHLSGLTATQPIPSGPTTASLHQAATMEMSR
jgi:eukaryotic-like serine/threonine-protein kinase